MVDLTIWMAFMQSLDCLYKFSADQMSRTNRLKCTCVFWYGRATVTVQTKTTTLALRGKSTWFNQSFVAEF